MYKIDKTDYGFKLTFSGFIEMEEMKKWVEESKTAVESAPNEFGILVDMRELKPLLEDVQPVMQEGQKIYKEKGMKRSCVILASSTISMQFKSIAKKTGIYQWERYIDASAVTDWENVAVAWIKDGTDPDA